jgi:hypothetical protein
VKKEKENVDERVNGVFVGWRNESPGWTPVSSNVDHDISKLAKRTDAKPETSEGIWMHPERVEEPRSPVVL